MATLIAGLENDLIKLSNNATEDDLQVVIRAAYKQVLGNAHLMEFERITSAESLLRNGDITVRGFVRMIANSDLYKSLFFSNSSPYRFIELNCKHLLGRAPLDQAEISTHVQLYNSQGYEAEINSYIDSDEYSENFGENTVPYPRSIRSQVGIKNSGFNRMFALLRGPASSDAGKAAKLITSVAANMPSKIKPTTKAKGHNSGGNTNKRFAIEVTKAGNGRNFPRINVTYNVNYEQMSQKIQNIHRGGGKIVSITEIV